MESRWSWTTSSSAPSSRSEQSCSDLAPPRKGRAFGVRGPRARALEATMGYLDSQDLMTGGTQNPKNTTAGLSCQNLAQVVGTYVGGNVNDLGLPGVDALGNTVRHDLAFSKAI